MLMGGLLSLISLGGLMMQTWFSMFSWMLSTNVKYCQMCCICNLTTQQERIRTSMWWGSWHCWWRLGYSRRWAVSTHICQWMRCILLQLAWHIIDSYCTVASFPGLPLFFCSSVALTLIHGCGRVAKNGEGLVRFITWVMSCGCRGGGAQLQISLNTDRRSCVECLESQNHLRAFKPGWVDDELIQNLLKWQ